ncbi:hypothetical protein CFIMG_005601RA [Ceratocystis fimbriata CBS 114723]|uniref:Uncharacterized protein n=1 Tax=Ceratocystis fimbriata CBS 114723 TaxID=1035309 RepID=A0A2C5WYF8_9PEZI|nr:hypothetical protein CFIMG_005601RA [Ceratocystis fimbriata CBS 114723]
MSAPTSPRSVGTATRFTSQTPQAQAMPSKNAARGPVGETTAQRVARLRAAHLAAREAPLSSTDQIILKGRKFFDVMHRVTQRGLVGLTAVAFVFTVYAAFDMIKFNKQRKTEFLEAQQKMAADSLEAARVAYISGKATPEQLQMVEAAMAEAKDNRLPPLLNPPSKPIKSSIWDSVDKKIQEEAGVASISDAGKMAFDKENQATSMPPKPSKKWWFF